MYAYSISGGIASLTLAEADTRALPGASMTAPSVASYDSLTPSGRVLFSSPLRARFSTAEPPWMFELESTARPLAFAPDSDQPAPARSSVRTGSSNATSMVLSDVALALVMRGTWASARSCRNDSEEPSALPSASASAVWFTVSLPVALAAAGTSNAITCIVPPSPEYRRGGPPDLPGDSSRAGYGGPPATETGSV